MAAPSLKQAVLSPTAIANAVASLAMLLCLFLPHSIGCDQRVRRPLEHAVAHYQDDNQFLTLVTLWPYLLAAATLGVVGILVLFRPRWAGRALLVLPVTVAIVLLGAWSALLFNRAAESRLAMTIAVITFPAVTFVTARMVWLWRENQTLAAACWGQGFLCVLGAFSLRWFWFPPVERLMWGGVLSIAALLAMMAAAWTWPSRAIHDLVDRSTPATPVQSSLRQLIIAVALAAIAMTYWRLLGH